MKQASKLLSQAKTFLLISLSGLLLVALSLFTVGSGTYSTNSTTTSISTLPFPVITVAHASFGEGLKNPAAAGSLLGGEDVDVSSGDTALTAAETLISRIIGFLTVLAGIFFIIYFILGALSWVTAGGDQSKIQKARDQIVQGVIGLIVIVGAYAVVGIIGSVVGINILNPAAQLRTIFGI